MAARGVPGEWSTCTLADAVQAGEHGPARVLVKAGTVAMTDGGGLRLAVQVDDGPMVILAPASAALLLGALRRSYHDVIAEVGGQLGHGARVGR